MALPDSLDYTRDFYVQNVDCTLRAEERCHGEYQVPEREFRNFVLPIRVNNENLDSSRAVFYEELKDRVKGLSCMMLHWRSIIGVMKKLHTVHPMPGHHRHWRP